MKKSYFSFVLSVIILYSMTAAAINAAPVRFNQIVQVVNAKPGKADTGSFTQLRLAGDDPLTVGDDDEQKKTAPPQDDRVITETKSEIVEDDVCDCVSPSVVTGGFPYGWLALGATPLLFLVPPPGDEPPNDTPPPAFTPTPTPTPTPPPTTPTPTPTPEPMTLLLFGSGLAGIGFAARRRFGKKDEANEA